MMNVLLEIARECWFILLEAAPFVLLGFAVAGLMQGLLVDRFIARHIGGNSFGAVIKASLLGIPLPLCSCGVIPAAVELRKQGAGKGASAAFLVSTPESGVDSIAITYALLDPVMTVIRPLAAFFTATVTGLAINRLPEETAERPEPEGVSCCAPAGTAPPQPFPARIVAGLRYAFGELMLDIGGWLLLGILIAGLIGTFVPDSFFRDFSGSEAAEMIVMLLVGIPLYICASASTPVAAALILKGISPGAALVFLLAGPATNAATITIVSRFWGKKATLLYLGSIAICSLLVGWLTNRLYAVGGWDLSTVASVAPASGPTLLSSIMALAVLLLVLRGYVLKLIGKQDSCCASGPGADP